MIEINTLLDWGATYKKVAIGEMIFREGTEGHFYYQLVSGSVRWVNINEDGREFIQYIVEPGECFGELTMFEETDYAASAIANKESLVLRLQKASFIQLLKENPSIHFSFTTMLAQRLRDRFLFLNEVACHSPEHRIEALFNVLKKTNKGICPKCYMNKLTRQQVANMTGLRVETVIRTIRDLENRGILSIERGKVFCGSYD